jgi:hypothetical protein
MKNKYVLRLLLRLNLVVLVSLFLAIPRAHAAYFTETFTNDFEMDEFYLWIEPEDSDIIFSDWPFVPSHWEIELIENTYLHGYFKNDHFFEPYRGRWQITFHDNIESTNWLSDFSMPWAELLNGEIIGTGYLHYDAYRHRWSHRFEPVVVPPISEVPLPSASMLLVSGLLLLIGHRLRHRIPV